jgi:hypothetical protein
MNYCVGCGEKKRIRWLDGFCTKHCAAIQALALFGAQPMGFCPDCGELYSVTSGCACPLNDEESI